MKTIIVDMHCHTSDHSHDGKVSALEIVQRLVELQFAGVVFTDHNYTWPEEELAELRHLAGLPGDFLLFSGQEVRTAREGVTHGDLLVYGPKVHLPDGTPPADVIRLAREAGGFCTAPHPSVPVIGFGDHVRYGGRVALQSERIAREHGLPEVGGSDTHSPEDIGNGGTILPSLPGSLGELRDLIRDGHSRAWRPDSLGRAFGWLRRLAGR
jgi:predicted metal-dependent phosphoesterase TrpH